MNVTVLVFLMCLFHLTNPGRKIYIPPLARTSGVVRWYIHSDIMCAFDARRHCEQLYRNGRLLQLESGEMQDILAEKYNNLTNPIKDPFTVGLWAAGNITHQDWIWTDCDVLDLKTTRSGTSWAEALPCYRYFDEHMMPTVFGAGLFAISDCSAAYPYACEDISTEQSCDIEEILHAEADSIVGLPADACDAKCQELPNCWGTLYIRTECLLMKNTDVGIDTDFKMKRKNCVKELIETSVVDYSQSCVEPSTGCSSPTTQDDQSIALETTTSFSFGTHFTMYSTTADGVSCPENSLNIQTQTVTITDHITLAITEVMTVPTTVDLIETVTAVYSITEVLTEPTTVVLTETTTAIYNFTEVLTEPTTVVQTETMTTTYNFTEVLTEPTTVVLTETMTTIYNFTDVLTEPTTVVLTETTTAIYNFTEIVTEPTTVITTETMTAIYNFTHVLTEPTTLVLTETLTSTYNFTEVLMEPTTVVLTETMTAIYNFTLTSTYNFTEVLTEPTTVVSTETMTAIYNFTEVLVDPTTVVLTETLTAIYNFTEVVTEPTTVVLMETITATYNITDTLTTTFNFTEVLVDPTTVVLTETLTAIYNFTEVVTEPTTVVLMETITATYNITDTLMQTTTVICNTTDAVTETTTVTATVFNASRSEMCTPIVNYTTAQLEAKIEELTKKMKVKKSETSAKLRTLTCAKDDRPSAQAVGLFGLAFIVAPLAVIVLIDIPRFIVEFYAKFTCKK